MIGIIISGHGLFAEGMKSSVELISGEQDNLFTINFLENIGVDKFKKSLRNTLEEVEKKFDEVILFTDIPGGTPFNQAAYLLEEYKDILIVGGVNLPIILDTVLNNEATLDEIRNSITSMSENAFIVIDNEVLKK
ncbi:PTS sugar transporter subunit IIA [Carnobacteriaceae bacterium 52-44]